MNIHHPALFAIADACKNTSYENKLWLVGGAVRDFLLNHSLPNDFDIVLEGDALALANFLYTKKVSHAFPILYPRFGTALIQIQQTNIELVTARKESYQDGSRKPEIKPATLYEDALRRDFTINTLMMNLHTKEILDPLGTGLQDLQKRCLRTPLDPVKTFQEDPLRMLRAIRFRFQIGCEPIEGLYGAIHTTSERLQIISAERIRDELSKMLLLKDADQCFQDLLTTGLLNIFAPELLQMVGVDQGSHHHLDVWNHSLLTLKYAGQGDLALSWAALLHDVAKPATKFVEPDGKIHFWSHEVIGAEIARKILKRLRYSDRFIEEVALLIKNHMRLGQYDELSSSAIRRILRDLGEHLTQLFKLTEADAMAHKPGLLKPDFSRLREQLESVSKETPAHKLKSPLNGQQIMELLGIPAGPEVGKVKAFLNEKILEGQILPGDEKKAKELLKKEWHLEIF